MAKKAKKILVRTPADIVREIRHHLRGCGYMDFVTLSAESKHIIAKGLEAWIEPLLTELEGRLDKKAKLMDSFGTTAKKENFY